MLIQVAYPDEKYDYVKDFMLDRLIDENKVVKFRRRLGWVTVGVDQVRSKKNDTARFYPERRAARRY